MRIDRAFFVICIFAAACGDGSSNHAGGTPRVPLSAVFQLFPGPKFAVGLSPTSVAAADLNGDDRLDLVTADLNSDALSVLIGRGDGSFGDERELFAGASPHSVAIADLDGDGHSDLVVTTLAVGEVSVLLGHGDATFGPPQIFPIGIAVGQGFVPAVADLDGNGHLDVVTANGFNSTSIAVLMGRGDGTLGAATTLTVGSSPTSIAVADLDGDRHLDLVAAIFDSNDVSVLFGKGD